MDHININMIITNIDTISTWHQFVDTSISHHKQLKYQQFLNHDYSFTTV